MLALSYVLIPNQRENRTGKKKMHWTNIDLKSYCIPNIPKGIVMFYTLFVIFVIFALKNTEVDERFPFFLIL